MAAVSIELVDPEEILTNAMGYLLRDRDRADIGFPLAVLAQAYRRVVDGPTRKRKRHNVIVLPLSTTPELRLKMFPGRIIPFRLGGVR